MEKTEFFIEEKDSALRIDKALILYCPFFTRSYIQKLIEDGFVKVNGKDIKSNYKVKEGDRVSVTEPPIVPLLAKAEDIPLNIVYEDEEVLVINKPRGMVVHPAAGNYTGTLVNAVLHYCGDNLSAINGVLRPGIVHRLDKDTTGLLVVAKTNDAHLKLSSQLKDRSLSREYFALVHGNIKEDTGRVDAPLGRNPNDRKKMCVTDKNSREAITDFSVVERFGQFTLVKCKLKTGRTHQIRVHMRYIGHSVVGDKTYGLKNEPFSLDGQLLHAAKISFVHPKDEKVITVSCPLPDDFEKILDILRKKQKK